MLTPKETTVDASEAKVHFGAILRQCTQKKKAITIKRHKNPIAVLVPIEIWDNRQGKKQELSPLVERILKLRERIKKYRKAKGIKDTKSSVEWVREIRDEREKKLCRQHNISV